MTAERMNQVIAEHCGDAAYGIKKRGLYYGPNFCGYTNDENKAGRYTLEEAKTHESVKGRDDDVFVVPLLPKKYYSDLNLMHEAENILDKDLLIYSYAHYLYNVVVPLSTQPFRATAKQRAEAFIRTIAKWED